MESLLIAIVIIFLSDFLFNIYKYIQDRSDDRNGSAELQTQINEMEITISMITGSVEGQIKVEMDVESRLLVLEQWKEVKTASDSYKDVYKKWKQ